MSVEVQVAGGRTPFDLVVVAASFGGVEALAQLFGALPTDFPVPILAVQHRPAPPDRLAEVLGRRSSLPVHDLLADRSGACGRLEPGIHLTAPHTAYELLDGQWRVSGPSKKPADDLMTSAAAARGRRVCAVVLTGRLDDGALGVRAVKRAGGRVIVQDPEDARAGGMPRAAVATGCADLTVPLRVVAPALVALTMAPGAIEMFPAGPRPWANLSGV